MGGLCGKGKKGKADTTTGKPNAAEVEVVEENGEKRSPSLPSIKSGGFVKSNDSGFSEVVSNGTGPNTPSIVNGNYGPLFQKEPGKKSPRPPTPKAPPAPPANKETGMETVQETPPPPDENAQDSAPVEREPYKSTLPKVVIGLPTSRRRRRRSWKVKKLNDYNDNRTSSRPTVLPVPERSSCPPTVLCPPPDECSDFC